MDIILFVFQLILIGLVLIFSSQLIILCITSFFLLLSLILKLPSFYKFGSNILFKTGFNLEENFFKLPKSPCILMSNYCAKKNPISYLAQTTLPCKYSLVVSDVQSSILNRVYTPDQIIYIKHKSKDNYQYVKAQIKDRLEKGYYIFCYIEDISPEKSPYKIKKLRSGIFSIAKELDVPIVPIVMDNITSWLTLLFPTKFRIIIGNKLYVKQTKSSMNIVLKWMKKKLNTLSNK